MPLDFFQHLWHERKLIPGLSATLDAWLCTQPFRQNSLWRTDTGPQHIRHYALASCSKNALCSTKLSKNRNKRSKLHNGDTASKTVNQFLLATDTSAPFNFFFSGGFRWLLTDLLALLPETCWFTENIATRTCVTFERLLADGFPLLQGWRMARV